MTIACCEVARLETIDLSCRYQTCSVEDRKDIGQEEVEAECCRRET
jgi:hypothetical protein